MTNQDEMAKKAAPEQVAPVVAKGGVRQQSASDEPAPPNGLPDWSECALRVGNSDFLAKRVAEGGYGADHDSKLASALHRFIYEYDDADSYRSAWFLHRLELVIEEVKRESILAATPTPSAETIDTPEFRDMLSALQGLSSGAKVEAIIAHIDARIAAARQEGAAQALEQAVQACHTFEREQLDPDRMEVAYRIAKAIRALRSTDQTDGGKGGADHG